MRLPKVEPNTEISLMLRSIWFYAFFFFLLILIASFGLIAEA